MQQGMQATVSSKVKSEEKHSYSRITKYCSRFCLFGKCFLPNYTQKYLRQDENFTEEMYHENDKIVFQNKDAKNNGRGRSHTFH